MYVSHPLRNVFAAVALVGGSHYALTGAADLGVSLEVASYAAWGAVAVEAVGAVERLRGRSIPRNDGPA